MTLSQAKTTVTQSDRKRIADLHGIGWSTPDIAKELRIVEETVIGFLPSNEESDLLKDITARRKRVHEAKLAQEVAIKDLDVVKDAAYPHRALTQRLEATVTRLEKQLDQTRNEYAGSKKRLEECELAIVVKETTLDEAKQRVGDAQKSLSEASDALSRYREAQAKLADEAAKERDKKARAIGALEESLKDADPDKVREAVQAVMRKAHATE